MRPGKAVMISSMAEAKSSWMETSDQSGML
jgi:hypothetical protein